MTVKDDFRHLRFAACVLPCVAGSTSSTFKELSTLAWALPQHVEWADAHGTMEKSSCLAVLAM